MEKINMKYEIKRNDNAVSSLADKYICTDVFEIVKIVIRLIKHEESFTVRNMETNEILTSQVISRKTEKIERHRETT